MPGAFHEPPKADLILFDSDLTEPCIKDTHSIQQDLGRKISDRGEEGDDDGFLYILLAIYLLGDLFVVSIK